jgi:hypothetical protein
MPAAARWPNDAWGDQIQFPAGDLARFTNPKIGFAMINPILFTERGVLHFGFCLSVVLPPRLCRNFICCIYFR